VVSRLGATVLVVSAGPDVVGASVAQDRYLLAATLAILNLITLRLLLPVKQKLDSDLGG
jgi:hypothetical protein